MGRRRRRAVHRQAGQIMSATALLARNIAPSDADIDAANGRNLSVRRVGRDARQTTRARSDGHAVQTRAAANPVSRRTFLKASALVGGGLLLRAARVDAQQKRSAERLHQGDAGRDRHDHR